MTPLHVALVLALLCGVAAWQVSVIPESMMQMAVGPSAMPAVVVGGLALLVLLYGISAARGRQVDESHEPDQSALPGANVRLLSLLGGGLCFMALIGPLGFILPATLCGLGVARGFDAPFGARSVAVCAAIAVVFWTLFARILGVDLGPGLPWLF